jgi:hypothetical protein
MSNWELWIEFDDGSTGRTMYRDGQKARDAFDDYSDPDVKPKSVRTVWLVVDEGNKRFVADGEYPKSWSLESKPDREEKA